MTALQNLRPSTLRALAAALEARQPPDRLCSSDLTPEGVERLADLFSQRQTPALGFWRKYRRTDGSND
jgi:hypothetical protein